MKAFFIIFCLGILACSNSFEQKNIQEVPDSLLVAYSERDSLGNLLKEGFMFNQKKHGNWKIFWPNGDVRQIMSYKNGVLDGEFIGYHPNGRIHYKGQLLNGLYVGFYDEYSDEGIILRKLEYNNLRDTSGVNRKYIFKPDGSIDAEKSVYYDLVLNQDTIVDGDELVVTIKFHRNYSVDKSLIRFDVLDEKFNVDLSPSVKTAMKIHGDVIKLTYGTYNHGENYFRAIVWDYIKGQYFPNGNQMYNNFYIDEKFWVLPRCPVKRRRNK